MPQLVEALDPATLLVRYRQLRARSRVLFDLLTDDAYYSKPIALRHPIVFYEGHLPAFGFNTLIKRALGRPGIDARLEGLFARGIDPSDGKAGADPQLTWPDRAGVQAFAAEVDRQVEDALTAGSAPNAARAPGAPTYNEAVFTILEHEAMHQETLLYMWHRLPFTQKQAPRGYTPVTGSTDPRHEWIDVGAGRATLGVHPSAIPFGWDNEFGARSDDVPAFTLERHDVTNGRYLEFVESGGYRDERWWRPEDWQWLRSDGVTHPLFWEPHDGVWHWRGMFELIRLPPAWPVYVSHAEASAFARWRGARLPTEAEFQRAAFGSPADGERPFPWGHDEPSLQRGVFDFSSWDPMPAGSCPAGRSAWGIDDLVGNGWEWTSSVFEPFPGFVPMPSYPEYSADFFDGEHFVMKGASPATARELLRPTFRNWFRARYPYVYATFRCANGGRAR